MSNKSRHRWLCCGLVLCTSWGFADTDETTWAVNTRQLPVEAVPAYPNLVWNGWEAVDEEGKNQDLRPVVLTHAGDGTDRVFVGLQRGVVHVFENREQAQETKVFLDLSDKVRYDPREFEEGFLGLAFHPNYAKTGEFFIYYTTTEQPHTSIIAKRRVSQDDPNRADPTYELELFRIQQPFWNHNGGNLMFGPDGYLYISLGDGGAADDPSGNGQNTQTLFGTILRIDIDDEQDGKPYAIPADNPFANNAQAGRPEIYAYGLRNVWGMYIDAVTGNFWAADVGQNHWEEIDLIVNGGNYGWNPREGLHKRPPRKSGKSKPTSAMSAEEEFDASENQAAGTEPSFAAGTEPSFINPIWEYDHETGKSITGGVVYRGDLVPDLVGAYVYADFVSGKIWALRYDEEHKRVVSNQRLASPQLQITSFGLDEQQELKFTVTTSNSPCIFQFRPKP